MGPAKLGEGRGEVRKRMGLEREEDGEREDEVKRVMGKRGGREWSTKAICLQLICMYCIF